MRVAERFVVRRCDSFDRVWHDVSDQVSLLQAQETYDRLTCCGTRNNTPDEIDYYDIFAADPLPDWPDASRPPEQNSPSEMTLRIVTMGPGR